MHITEQMLFNYWLILCELSLCAFIFRVLWRIFRVLIMWCHLWTVY